MKRIRRWLTGSVSKYRWELVMIALSGMVVGGGLVSLFYQMGIQL